MIPLSEKKIEPPAPAIVKTYFTLSKIISPIFFLSGPLLSKYGGFMDTVPERLGKFSPALEILNHKRGNRHLVWIHAVSVGEAAIAGAITDAIRNRSDKILVAFSTTTFTGLDYIRRNCTPDSIFFFPIDLPSAMHKLVDKIRPDCFIDVEVELWPNCFRELRLAGIPMALANGRISDRAANPAPFMRKVYKWLFGCFDVLFMRSEEDVNRVVALGAPRERTRLAGNLKFAACNKPLPDEQRSKLREILGAGERGRIFVAGSTHPGEDEKIIASWRDLNNRILPENLKPLILVLAPRHLEQVERLRGLIANGSERVELWTAVRDGGINPGTTAIIVDTIGELNKLYGAADVAFVGGSLIKRGGHNVLEPVAVGTPTLHGQSMDNFHDLVRVLGNGGLLTEVADSKELGEAILKILTELDISEYRVKAEKVIDAQTKASGIIAEWVIEKIRGTEPGKGKRAEYRSVSERYEQPIISVCANGLLSPLTHAYARTSTGMVCSKIPGAEKLRTPVCSVGNIALGGTAKTPTVQYIAGFLARDGKNPAVILRGYMGRMDRENAPPKPVSDGKKILLDWTDSGDEAYLLGKNLIEKNIPVVIGRDRIKAGKLAIDELGAKTIILDDGFQFSQLARDSDIVLIDALAPFGRHDGRIGILREPASSISRADIVIITRSESVGESTIEEIIRRLKSMAVNLPPVFLARTIVTRIIDGSKGDEMPLDSLDGKRALAFTGIGNPLGFESTLESLNCEVARLLSFPDHYPFGKEDPEKIILKARRIGAEMALTTEKDAVRLQRYMPDFNFPLRIVEIGISVDDETGFHDMLSEKLGSGNC